jgi:ADP-dependent NAD(P)H-hydrate dehydratase / NAD(P)H-hydrate epimerase
MSELLSAAQMRAIETAAIAAGKVTGLELMERAGQGVVEAIFAAWPDWARTPRKVVVLCGPGNNGGDGFVIARLLADKGWQVETHLLGDPDDLPLDAKANHDRWIAKGPNKPLNERSFGTVKSPPDLVVDALFGTGLKREIEGDAAFLLGNLETLRQEFGVKCVAVDIPSGVCADSGRPLGCFPQVDLTVTFHTEKPGHCLERADSHCGRVVVWDIGLPHAEQSRQRAAHVWKVEPPSRAVLDKPGTSQKYDFGHALILSGGAGKTGAARLAARGALRVGAGLVTLGVPKPALPEVAGQITALMMVPVSTADDLGEVLWDTRINALCLGPGLGPDRGKDNRARDLVETALSMGRALVLDADALSMFRTDPDALLSKLHDKCVLTPHGGEFARLFPDIAKRLQKEPKSGPAYSRVDAVRAAAKRAGCTILLKGPDTVIAGPDGQCAIHSALFERAAPWLATAGSGDVLAGFVTGLLARGFAPMLAAETAAWLHVQCAVNFGPGLIAEDIADALPGVFDDLNP